MSMPSGHRSPSFNFKNNNEVEYHSSLKEYTYSIENEETHELENVTVLTYFSASGSFLIINNILELTLKAPYYLGEEDSLVTYRYRVHATENQILLRKIYYY